MRAELEAIRDLPRHLAQPVRGRRQDAVALSRSLIRVARSLITGDARVADSRYFAGANHRAGGVMAEATARAWTGWTAPPSRATPLSAASDRPRRPPHRSRLHPPDLRQLCRRRRCCRCGWTAAMPWPRPPPSSRPRARHCRRRRPAPLDRYARMGQVFADSPHCIAAPSWAAPSPPSATSRCGTRRHAAGPS